MSTFDHAELAVRVVEATIRVLSGHFRKGKSLKQFYRDIREGRAKCFVALRADPEDFIGLFFDRTGPQQRFELWVNLEERDEGVHWCREMATQKFGAVQFSYRSPQAPLTLARQMGFRVPQTDADD
ncbi:hypothetical protein HY480_00635 [Candidatus Uhrbacteria bacterium]|nr:hypothetical protein [Candidatus Uhrbacteria bacterium]